MKTLNELKEMNLPTAILDLQIKEEVGGWREDKKIAEEYLNNFLPYNPKCIKCNSELGGILGSFTWGMSYGEGYCNECGYPSRFYHNIKDRNDVTILKFNAFMQYHPNILDEEIKESTYD